MRKAALLYNPDSGGSKQRASATCNLRSKSCAAVESTQNSFPRILRSMRKKKRGEPSPLVATPSLPAVAMARSTILRRCSPVHR